MQESQLSETRQQLRVAREDVTRVRVREEGLKTQLQDQLSSHTELQHKLDLYIVSVKYLNSLQSLFYIPFHKGSTVLHFLQECE